MDFDWQNFLQQWSRDLIDSVSVQDLDLSPEEIASGWLGYPAASDEQLAATEARLGCSLPPSYRAFLKVSDGWFKTSADELLEVEQIEWLATHHQDLIDFYVRDELVTLDPSIAHLQHTLLISKWRDDVLLLNPKEIDANGEWEAWHFAEWNPGQLTFPSFRALMEQEYEWFRDGQRMRRMK